MGAYKHIRALSRAIMVLSHLNLARESSSAAIAAAIDLPKTTTYRILQSLIDCELVYFSPSHGCFRLTPKVDTLAAKPSYSGFLQNVVEPALNQLSLSVLWPCEFCVPAGSAMAIVSSTRRSSPFTLPELFGMSSHPSNSPVGRAYYAFNNPVAPEMSRPSRTSPDGGQEAGGPQCLLADYSSVRTNGYALGRTPLSPYVGALAVPIRTDMGAVGALHVQWLWSEQDSGEAAIETVLPHLRAAQAQIEGALCALPSRSLAS